MFSTLQCVLVVIGFIEQEKNILIQDQVLRHQNRKIIYIVKTDAICIGGYWFYKTRKKYPLIN